MPQQLSLRMLKHSAPVLNPLAQEQIKQRVLLSIQSQPADAFARFTPTPESPRLLPGDEWLCGSECRPPKERRSSPEAPAFWPGSVTAPSLRFSFAKLTAVSAFGLLAIAGTAYASTAANPGDILYPIKRAQENVRLTLAPSQENKADLQATFAQERIREFKNISKVKSSRAALKVISNPNAVIQNAAKKEVKNSLRNLKTTETNLKQQGKIKASLAVHEKINGIKREAKEQNLIEESADN